MVFTSSVPLFVPNLGEPIKGNIAEEKMQSTVLEKGKRDGQTPLWSYNILKRVRVHVHQTLRFGCVKRRFPLPLARVYVYFFTALFVHFFGQ